MRLLRKTDVDPADDGGILRKHFDQSLFLSRINASRIGVELTPNCPANAFARQGRSRWQRQRGNQLAQLLEDLRRRLPVAVERASGSGRRTA